MKVDLPPLIKALVFKYLEITTRNVFKKLNSTIVFPKRIFIIFKTFLKSFFPIPKFKPII